MSEIKKEPSKNLYVKNEELENYFANTIIPQLYVDGQMILRKFTPPAMVHFSLTKADIDRDINEVKDNIRYPTLIENIEEVIATSEILEKEVQTTDGKWFQMNILPYKVFKENRTNGVIITFVDITNRITTLKELEKLNAQHDTLMYALSHDIRQPLTSIVLLADVLMQAYKNQNTEQFTKWIGTLKTTSNTMKSLVKDFTEENEIKPEATGKEERVNIQNIAQDVILALKSDIFNKGINITTNFQTSEIIFSRNNLRSIVYNLLSNAIKYKSPESPLEIIISTKRINDYVLLKVKDNGLGIAEEHQKNIFKKATRINSNIEGTGMGLYIIKRMIENNDGKVEVKSQLGEGSTFSVFFKSGYEGEE
ncbi:ATP-binding protein [Gillisia limnaea]|uniref:histidine kinase n=1 Tax=Gillisia limnaea (strain DSM 15749 / LMG 21470 / R-8282) TaxID=865937 RepID=H2BS24_GILLR|nr:ATP-binding protein [Gillisia limnaea]EHQ03550.1 histidine kinase [Gillisia limnaea DSM 15749]